MPTTNSHSDPRPASISLRKALLGVAVLLVSTSIALALAEGAVRLLGLASRARAEILPDASIDRYVAENGAEAGSGQAEQDEEGEDAPALSRHVANPYLGYSPRPGAIPLTRFELEDYPKVRESDYNVGIFGGSVARALVRAGGDAFVQELERLRPELAGKVKVLDFGLGGYKQPQQLFGLTEALLLDIPLDAVINLDGFNDLALAETNAVNGVHPIFPHFGHLSEVLDMSAGVASMAEVETTAAVLRDRRRAEHLRALVQGHALLRHSALAKAFLGTQYLRVEARAAANENQLAELALQHHTQAMATLWDPCMKKGKSCAQLIARLWQQSSEMMALLARSRDILYLHALQPNQYPANAKPLSPEERERAWAPNHPWSQWAAGGYPELQHRGAELRREGIDFQDLSTLFQDHRETLYQDTCCHLNQRGNKLLAEALAQHLSRAIETQATQRSSG